MSGLVGDLRGHVDAAGAVLGLPGGAGADAVAAAILARRAEDWDEASLDKLRRQGRIVEHLGVPYVAFPTWTPIDLERR